MYADYDYYRTLYGGRLSDEEYTFAAARASEYLASVTHDRITEDILADDTTGRAVKMCCCAMADLIQKQEQRDGKTAEKTALVDALREQNIPAQLSYSAGTFVCNNLLYCALHESAQRYPALRCGFVHVPYLPEQTKDGNAPSMGLEMMVKALHIAVEAIAEEEKQ